MTNYKNASEIAKAAQASAVEFHGYEKYSYVEAFQAGVKWRDANPPAPNLKDDQVYRDYMRSNTSENPTPREGGEPLKTLFDRLQVLAQAMPPNAVSMEIRRALNVYKNSNPAREYKEQNEQLKDVYSRSGMEDCPRYCQVLRGKNSSGESTGFDEKAAKAQVQILFESLSWRYEERLIAMARWQFDKSREQIESLNNELFKFQTTNADWVRAESYLGRIKELETELDLETENANRWARLVTEKFTEVIKSEPYLELKAERDQLRKAYESCIEGFEGTIGPEFWESPLGKHLKTLGVVNELGL